MDDYNKNEENIILFNIKSITIHDIYYLLKSLPINKLRQIYLDRAIMIEKKEINSNIYNFFNKSCISTIIQSELMK
jgi:hypothetical protein